MSSGTEISHIQKSEMGYGMDKFYKMKYAFWFILLFVSSFCFAQGSTESESTAVEEKGTYTFSDNTLTLIQTFSTSVDMKLTIKREDSKGKMTVSFDGMDTLNGVYTCSIPQEDGSLTGGWVNEISNKGIRNAVLVFVPGDEMSIEINKGNGTGIIYRGKYSITDDTLVFSYSEIKETKKAVLDEDVLSVDGVQFSRETTTSN